MAEANDKGVPLVTTHGELRPKVVGVYVIRCTTTGKVYVGSSTNVWYRRYDHYNALCKNVHFNKHLQAAWRKYGPDAFTFTCVVECQDSEALVALEREWLDKLNACDPEVGFNTCPDPEHGTRGVRNWWPARKSTPAEIEGRRQALLGKKHSLERRLANSQARIGKPLPPESVAKRTDTNRRKYLERVALGVVVKRTPEHCQAIAASLRGKKRSPEAIAKFRSTMAARREARMGGRSG